MCVYMHVCIGACMLVYSTLRSAHDQLFHNILTFLGVHRKGGGGKRGMLDHSNAITKVSREGEWVASGESC